MQDTLNVRKIDYAVAEKIRREARRRRINVADYIALLVRAHEVAADAAVGDPILQRRLDEIGMGPRV